MFYEAGINVLNGNFRLLNCLKMYLNSGRVFTSGFLGRLASDNRKSRENSYFSNSLKVKRVGKLQ